MQPHSPVRRRTVRAVRPRLRGCCRVIRVDQVQLARQYFQIHFQHRGTSARRETDDASAMLLPVGEVGIGHLEDRRNQGADQKGREQ